jgi:ribosome biogenesis GTPase / thiamine phosphate phosphatase
MCPVIEGTIVCARSGFWEVATEGGLVVCRMRGRLKQGKRTTDLAVIGDRVGIEPPASPGGEGVIVEVLPRRTVFSRLQPGSRRPVEDVLAANLDLLVVCAAAVEPPLRPRLIDRFLVIAEWNRIAALIVVTKVDDASALEPHRAALEARERAGYPVLATSARTGAGMEALRQHLDGRTAAFVGPSGAGKSSLLNALDPALDAEVGALNAVNKGGHTTRVARLFSVGTATIADTPGIRELAPWEIPPEALGHCFPEIRALLPRCQYGDCLHQSEPGCAVRAAADAGELSADRYDSYLRQLRNEA